MTANPDAAVVPMRPEGLVQSPVFSHVAVVPPGMTTVMVDGQDGVDADGHIVGSDVATQAGRAFGNLETALAAAGATLADVVRLQIYGVEGVDALAVLPPSR